MKIICRREGFEEDLTLFQERGDVVPLVVSTSASSENEGDASDVHDGPPRMTINSDPTPRAN